MADSKNVDFEPRIATSASDVPTFATVHPTKSKNNDKKLKYTLKGSYALPLPVGATWWVVPVSSIEKKRATLIRFVVTRHH